MSRAAKLACRVVTYLYHEVTDDPSSTGFQSSGALPYKHRVQEFARNLDAIAESGMTPVTLPGVTLSEAPGVTLPGVTLSEAPGVTLSEAKGKVSDVLDLSSEAPQLVLTFDDGGKSAMDISRELDRRGWKGHFFITTSMIDDPRFVSRADVKSLQDRGHVVGAHSHTHPVPFYSQTRARLLEEWTTSTKVLADIIGQPIVAASVPGGDLDRVVQETAAAAGIRFLFTSEPTYTPWEAGGVINFGRVYPLAGTPVDRVARYTALKGFRRDMTKRRVKQVGRKALGPLYSMVVSRLFSRSP